ncbi:MAG: hypothetical protein RLZZ480_868 [Candidatus Parcubacteria bacterium]|jgi:hypothetical protein
MNIPVVRSLNSLREYGDMVKSRRWHLDPTSYGLVATHIGRRGALYAPIVRLIQPSDELDCSGVLAGVTRHRSGNGVYELGFNEIKDLEKLFGELALDAEKHPFASTILEVCQLTYPPHNMKVFAVFTGPCHKDWREQSLEGSSKAIFMKFLQHAGEQLAVAR